VLHGARCNYRTQKVVKKSPSGHHRATQAHMDNRGGGVCKTVRPMLSDRCLSVCPVCDLGVLWPNGWMDPDEIWHGGKPRPRPHCVRWGPSTPQKGHSTQFSAHVRCSQTAGWTTMPPNAMSPGSRPTSVPSGILIHRAV